jgi:hypothetical protein
MSPKALCNPARVSASFILRAVAVLAGLAASTAPARAEFKAYFNGLNEGHSPAGSYKWYQKPDDYADTLDAYPDLKYVNTIDRYGNSHFLTFCIQKNVSMQSNPHYFTVKPLEEAPDAGPMGENADMIRMMWARWRSYLDVSDKSTETKRQKDIDNKHDAFAHAIWHLVNQFDGDGDGSNLDGDVKKYYLKFLNEDYWDEDKKANLLALVGRKGYKDDQDQIIEYCPPPPGNDNVVPAPAALVLALTGIAPCLFLRRRVLGRKAS